MGNVRIIDASLITEKVAAMCGEAACVLPEDVKTRMEECRACEPRIGAVEILDRIIENYTIAEEEFMPMCQDTGLTCVFLEIGSDVHIDGDIKAAVNAGVARGSKEAYLRNSVVADPLDGRKNTGDNTPAMLYIDIVPGDKLKITVAPKGFGSENMSRIAMLKPSDGRQGVIDFAVETVEIAGPNPCPPTIVGIGIGGTFDKAAYLAKKAAIRNLDERNPNPYYARLEEEILERVNSTGIGPQGFGGKTTSFAVNIEQMPTHIGGLPVAVNINCHAARHKTEVL